MKSKRIGHLVTIQMAKDGIPIHETKNMKHVKKLLVVHGDAKARRQLTLLLAGVGFDVRVAQTVDEALEKSQAEIFDLALVEHVMGVEDGGSCVSRLRKVQPTMPAVLLVRQLDVPLVVAGIRAGVEDVLALSGDMSAVIRRVCALVGAVDCAPADAATMETLAESESVLTSVSSQPDAGAPVPGVSGHDEAGAFKAIRQSVADLEGQRQALIAAQELLDAKARAIDCAREELDRDRQRMADERAAQVASAQSPATDALAEERESLERRSREVAKEAERVRGEFMRLHQERAQLDAERRRWHDDMDLLREQEGNLRQYEARLREMQARMESDHVKWTSANTRQASVSPFAHEGALKEAWAKLQRATEIFEAERAHLREDRLAFREMEKSLKKREEALALKERQQAANERRLREAAVQREAPAQPLPSAPAEEPSPLKSFTRTPFAVAKAVFGGGS